MVETVGDDQPMYFIQGMSGLPEAFEDRLNGLAEGDTFDFKLDPEQGYGDYDTEAVAEIPLEVFKVDGKLQEDILQVGNMVPMTNEEGHRLMGQIVEIDEEFVLMDFNHPLAGREMHFVGKVHKVRAATPKNWSTDTSTATAECITKTNVGEGRALPFKSSPMLF